MDQLIKGARDLGLRLSTDQVRQFELYYRELIDWNKKINLTAITGYTSVQVKHFLDSLTITLALSENELEEPGFAILDIGTGAGFPGLPLKILLSELTLVLMEPTAKKTGFLRHIVQALKLEKIEVLTARAEEAAHLPPYRERFSLVLSRAVAPLPTLVELTLPFCRPGGKFVAQKKGDIRQELSRAEKAIAALGGKLDRVREVQLPAFGEVRYLVIIEKIMPTPVEYPRRPGLPKRRPIEEVKGHVA